MNDVTVICGDAIAELAAYEGQAQLVLTSPPYGAVRDYGGHAFDWRAMINAIVPTLRPGGVLVWVVNDQIIDGRRSGTSFEQALFLRDHCNGIWLHDVMAYHKLGGIPGQVNRHKRRWELMIIASRGKPRVVNIIRDVPCKKVGQTQSLRWRDTDGSMKNGGVGTIGNFALRSNVWGYYVGFRHSYPDYADAREHPATFPLALARDHVRTWSNPGDLVIDPMAGSGTTLVAAAELGRRAVGIEIHEPYVDLIHRRLAHAHRH